MEVLDATRVSSNLWLLEATAVGIGRPTLFIGVHGFGFYGARRMTQILPCELQMNMAMVGVRRVRDLDISMLNTRRLEHLLPLGSCMLNPHVEQ